MGTLENLKAAFAGECQAGRRYLAFAKKAAEEGFEQVARLFRAAAAAETVHALNHLRAMGEMKSTAENLQAAIAGESHEYTEMYPAFIEEAQKEENSSAEISFIGACAVEEIHARLFKEALKGLGRNKIVDYWVCQVCGNTVEGEAPEQCPICGAARESFKKIE